MAWRSKRASRPTRWSGRRRTAGVQAKLNRKLNKRFQWVSLADEVCSQTALACKGCCVPPEEEETVRGCTYDTVGVVSENSPTPHAIVLIPPADDFSQEEELGVYGIHDTLTVVKLVGRIELCPAFCDSANKVALCNSDPGACAAYLEFQNQFRNYHMRAALDKSKWHFDPLTGQYEVPARFPMQTQEWTDAQFLRQWERYRGRSDRWTTADFNGNAPLGCCGDVTSPGVGAPTNTLSNGSGTVTIPAIETDCQPCGSGEDLFRQYGGVSRWMPCVTLSLNSRRRLTFKENEGLTFWIDYTSFDDSMLLPQPEWRPNVSWAYRLWLKALLEVA